MRQFRNKPTGRKPRWSAEQLEAALAAYGLGTCSVRTVKKDFGIPPTTLLRYAKIRGVEVRPSGLTGVKGSAHPAWRGGFIIDRDGYIRTYDPNHP